MACSGLVDRLAHLLFDPAAEEQMRLHEDTARDDSGERRIDDGVERLLDRRPGGGDKPHGHPPRPRRNRQAHARGGVEPAAAGCRRLSRMADGGRPTGPRRLEKGQQLPRGTGIACPPADEHERLEPGSERREGPADLLAPSP